MKNPPDPSRRLDHPEATELLAHPDRLISHVKTLRAEGDFRGATALLREALHQDPGSSAIRGLLAQTQLDLRFCDEKRAWLALLSETREIVEDHVERGELTEAETALKGVERRHGEIAELGDLRERLRGLRRERELAEFEAHLSEAQRMRDEGLLPEAVWEARQALALDPTNREATILADSLILEIEERELEGAVRRDASRVATLLGNGRLVRAGLLIRNSQRKYGNLPALHGQLQRRRRLRQTRWASRWGQVTDSTGAPARWIRQRIEDRRRLEMRTLITRVRSERIGRLALVAETRERLDELVEQGNLPEAQIVLERAENQVGAVVELEKLKAQLVTLRCESESKEFWSHIREAKRLRADGKPHEALGAARQALALDPQEHEATGLVGALVLEVEGVELEATTRRHASSIDTLLERGRLLWAEVQIKKGLSKYGSLPVFRDQLQRCERLKSTRWARRRALAKNVVGAPVLWVRHRVEERGKARKLKLISRLREEKHARLALVSETRARVEQHFEQGEPSEALAALVEVERRHGSIEDLQDWREYLEQEEIKVTARRDTGRIAELLKHGHLVRAEFLIRRSWRHTGESSALQHQLSRCRRLRATRWAERWTRLQEVGRRVPVDKLRGISTEASRRWTKVRQAIGVFKARIRSQLEGRQLTGKWVLIGSVTLIVVATAGAYLAEFGFQPRSASFSKEEVAATDPQPTAVVAPSGDLILDALPWGRVVAIVGQEGEQQELGDSLFTPVRRSLPVGSYRIVMENPAVEEPAEFWVQILPSGVTTKVHEFQPFDADAYFGKAGWQESGS